MSEETRKYTFANLLSDIIGIFIILLLCEVCGCHVFRGIGNVVGECVNAYKDTTHQIHPSDLR